MVINLLRHNAIDLNNFFRIIELLFICRPISSYEDCVLRRCLFWLYFYLVAIAGYGSLNAYEESNLKDVNIGKLILANGLQVCIISDPEMEESMGALSVAAGAWDDPKEFSGMAHFVEHLVFLGSKTYPKEDGFLEYIQQRGGKCNASTLKDRTTYGFSVNTIGLQEALDRFAHFFIDPLFSEEVIQRELKAVHHEFEDSRENDLVRIWKVFKHTGNPYHPNRNFSCGNLLSLSKVKRTDVLSWVKHHYEASKMRLVVASALPISQVAMWIEASFEQIPYSLEVKTREVHKEITSNSQRGSFFHLPPVLNNRHLSLVWEVPREFLNRSDIKGLSLLEKELSKPQAGSLSKLLEEEGLSKNVQAELWKMSQEQGVFCLHIKLTRKGTREYKKVVEKCFQAIARLSQKLKNEHSFIPLKSSHLKWKKIHDFQEVMHIAKDLIEISLDEYLSDDERDPQRELQVMEDFIQQMTPRQCIYFLVAPLEACGIVPTQLEKWMGIEYCVRKVSDSCLDQWEKEAVQSEMEFIFKEITSQKKEEVEEEVGLKEPVFIINSPMTKIRLVEPTFISKQIEIFFFIDTPLVSRTVKNLALSEIFVRCMNSVWKDLFPEEKEIRCELGIDTGRLFLVCSMPKEAALEQLPKIFLSLHNPQISLEIFEESKRHFLEHYEGDPDPIEYAHKILESLTTQFCSTEMQLYHAVSKTTYEEYFSWQTRVFDRLSLEGAFLGGIDEAKAKRIWEATAEVFPFIPYKSYEVTSKGSPYLEEKVARYWTQKTHRLGNALLFLISSRGEYAKNRVIHQIVSAFLQTEFFTELRTKQQTSYRLHSWTRVINNVICYGFSLQSSTHHPITLLKKVETFLSDLGNQVEERFSREQFEIFRESAITHWEKTKNQATKKEDRFFVDKNLEAVVKLSYEEVISNIQETFRIFNRKRLAILIEGRDFSATDREELFFMEYEPIEGW